MTGEGHTHLLLVLVVCRKVLIPTVPATVTTTEAFGEGRSVDRGMEAVARGEGAVGDARRAKQGFDSPRRRPYYWWFTCMQVPGWH